MFAYKYSEFHYSTIQLSVLLLFPQMYPTSGKRIFHQIISIYCQTTSRTHFCKKLIRFIFWVCVISVGWLIFLLLFRRKDREPNDTVRVCSCHFRDGVKANGPETSGIERNSSQ